MINLKTKLVASAATAVLLATAFAPATFAAGHIRVVKTGAGSINTVSVTQKQKTVVTQENETAVVNLVGVFQNTGGNTANSNTGGGKIRVNSGDATSHVTNTTTTGGNVANVDPCTCVNGDTNVTIKKTGAGSVNTVTITEKNKTKVTQSNETFVLNGVLVAQNTGGNEANSNTGDGTVHVDSGNATSTVTNTTTTGGNVLN